MSREEFYAVGSMPVEQADRLSGRMTRTELARRIAEAVTPPPYVFSGEISVENAVVLSQMAADARWQDVAHKATLIEAILTEQNLP